MIRNKVELLEITKANMDGLFITGLCQLFRGLLIHAIINIHEHDILLTILKDNPVSGVRIVDIEPLEAYEVYIGYYWPKGDKTMRIKYINSLIKKL